MSSANGLPVCFAICLLGLFFESGCPSDTAKVCAQQLPSLGTVCPLGSSPQLISNATGKCDANGNYQPQMGSAEIGGTCESSGSCTFACIVMGPTCPCGIASISRERIDCRSDCPAGCGDGICDNGETKASCPGDCAGAGADAACGAPANLEGDASSVCDGPLPDEGARQDVEDGGGSSDGDLDSPADAAGPFIGTWRTTGSEDVLCSRTFSNGTPLMSTMTFRRGTGKSDSGGATLILDGGSGCELLLEAYNGVASLVTTPQTCATSDGSIFDVSLLHVTNTGSSLDLTETWTDGQGCRHSVLHATLSR